MTSETGWPYRGPTRSTKRKVTVVPRGPGTPGPGGARLRTMRERLTFANVVSCIALFIALGGSAVALKANSVGSHQIRNDSVRGQDVRNGSLKGKDLAAGSVGERELAPTPSDPNSLADGQ